MDYVVRSIRSSPRREATHAPHIGISSTRSAALRGLNSLSVIQSHGLTPEATICHPLRGFSFPPTALVTGARKAGIHLNHVDGRREAPTETGEVTSADGTARSVRAIAMITGLVSEPREHTRSSASTRSGFLFRRPAVLLPENRSR